DTGADTLADVRTGKNGRHRLAGLLRQAVFGRRAGYEDVNDAERLCRDPAMRWVVGGQAIAGSAASASQMGVLRDKVAEPTREPYRSCRSARSVDRQGAPPARAKDHPYSTWIRARARPMANRKAAPITA